MRNVSLAFVAVFALLACSHQQPQSTLPNGSGSSDLTVSGGAEPSLGNNTDTGPDAVNDGAGVAIVPETPIYFDFDDAGLSDSAMDELHQVADYMRKGGAVHLVITGNTDERGTEEYNLALGDRRAQAARDYLMRLGVDVSNVKTISFGKLKPAVDGHDESAWSKNRRDELNLASSGSTNTK